MMTSSVTSLLPDQVYDQQKGNSKDCEDAESQRRKVQFSKQRFSQGCQTNGEFRTMLASHTKNRATKVANKVALSVSQNSLSDYEEEEESLSLRCCISDSESELNQRSFPSKNKENSKTAIRRDPSASNLKHDPYEVEMKSLLKSLDNWERTSLKARNSNYKLQNRRQRQQLFYQGPNQHFLIDPVTARHRFLMRHNIRPNFFCQFDGLELNNQTVRKKRRRSKDRHSSDKNNNNNKSVSRLSVSSERRDGSNNYSAIEGKNARKGAKMSIFSTSLNKSTEVVKGRANY